MKYFKKIVSFFIVTIFSISCLTSTFFVQAYKIKDEPMHVVSTKQVLNNEVNFNKNIIYVERQVGIIDKKDGTGHIIGYPCLEMDYGEYRYKGKPLPVKTVMVSFFFSNPFDVDGEPLDGFLARYDYALIRTKVKVKITKGKNKGKYTYKTKKNWVLLYCNGFNNN